MLAALNTVLHEAVRPIRHGRLRASAPDTRRQPRRDRVGCGGASGTVVLRANGLVEQIDVSGTAVGLRPVRYQAEDDSLDRGDTMLMFTDGIDEARGDDGFYGLERLIALLPAYAGAAPEVICEAVEENVVEYLDGRSHDDIALFAVTCGA